MTLPPRRSGQHVGDDVWVALARCPSTLVAASLLATATYRRRIS